jgi:hypothetical protein
MSVSGMGAADWVEQHRSLVDRAFAIWLETGEWPPVERLQRDLDRDHQDIDVLAAYTTMPRPGGQEHPLYPSALALPLRVLRYLPEGGSLLAVCFQIIRRGIEVYLADDAALELGSTDQLLQERAGSNVGLLLRAGALLLSDYPNPFAGGSLGDDFWTLHINVQSARQFRDVETLDDYFVRQASIIESSQSQEPTPTSPRAPAYVFVLMPFGEDWSAGVYDLIKRAVDSLRSEFDIFVERADDISRPGKITEQIIEAIRRADVVLADITGSNANVMWELGFAQALGKPPVILNQAIQTTPFDLHDWRQVSYSRTPVVSDERSTADSIRGALKSIK